MDDEPNVAVDAHRPEVRVLAPFESVELHTRRGRVQLEVECRRLGRLLLGASEVAEAVGEGVGDPELHRRGQPSAARSVGNNATPATPGSAGKLSMRGRNTRKKRSI